MALRRPSISSRFRAAALLLAHVWASPWTLAGLLVGLIGLALGGRVQRTGRIVEFYGPGTARLLRLTPIPGGAAAMTLGHVVLARDAAALEHTRSHELVHVRQYERWGPFFVPVYFLAGAWAWSCGRHPYYDNPFEREAFSSQDADAT
jgi:hypothetical protein